MLGNVTSVCDLVQLLNTPLLTTNEDLDKKQHILFCGRTLRSFHQRIFVYTIFFGKSHDMATQIARNIPYSKERFTCETNVTTIVLLCHVHCQNISCQTGIVWNGNQCSVFQHQRFDTSFGIEEKQKQHRILLYHNTTIFYAFTFAARGHYLSTHIKYEVPLCTKITQN